MNSKLAFGAVVLSTSVFPVSEVFASDLFYEVKPGDSFSKIVEELASNHDQLNYKDYYKLLTDLNSEKFDSLDKIFPGDKILLPTDKQVAEVVNKNIPKDFVTGDGTSVVKKYKVHKGDTLSEIAQKYINWDDIYSSKGTLQYLLKYNPQISNADFIFEDQTINLPSDTEVAKAYGATSKPGRLPASEGPQKEDDDHYREEALNPDFSFDGLRFNNVPGKLDDLGSLDEILGYYEENDADFCTA